MVYNILHANFNDLRMSQGHLVTVGPSTTAYAITLLMFISITIITLTNHLRGRHDTCRRNLVVSALLASVIMAVSSFRLPVPPAVQTLETVAYLTMLLTPLLLMLSVLIELNNQTGGAVKKRHETTAAGLRNMPAHGPATSPYRNEPGPANTNSRQEKRTDQPHMAQVPAQKPPEPPTPPINISRPQPPLSTARNIPRNTSKPAEQTSKTTTRENTGEKNRPAIEEIILSTRHAHLLTKLLIQILREGVKYNGKVHKVHLTFLRHQDIVYIWLLGKKKPPLLTDRAKHRLLSLRLVRVREKVRIRNGQAEIVEVAELMERGWAVRNAIAIAAQRILERKEARNAIPTVI
jgi:uncharacterized protein YoaH (UPF0181 family)